MTYGDAMPAFLSIMIVAGSAGAATQNPLNENLVPPAIAAPFQGEIEYRFDTTRNRGMAQYRTSLASGNLLKRLLSVPPDVHTLIVTYEFSDPRDRQPPSAIRLTLVSDEYCFASDAKAVLSQVPLLLVIHLPDSELRYPATVSQRTEVGSNAPPQLYRGLNQNDPMSQVQVNTGMVNVHIQRSATAQLPVNDFLAFAAARELRGTVAGLDFHFSEQVLAGLRQFAAEMHARPIVY